MFQGQLRLLNDESDRTEMQLESLNSVEGGKRGRKGGDPKKGDKEVCFHDFFLKIRFLEETRLS